MQRVPFIAIPMITLDCGTIAVVLVEWYAQLYSKLTPSPASRTHLLLAIFLKRLVLEHLVLGHLGAFGWFDTDLNQGRPASTQKPAPVLES